MSAVAMTASQVRYVNKSFWRNPASAFFTFALPADVPGDLHLALLGNTTVHIGDPVGELGHLLRGLDDGVPSR